MKRDPIHMQQDMLKTLITKDQLEATVARLGREITEDYRGRTPMLVAVLKGAFIFMADLVRQIDIPCTLDFMAVSSYGAGMASSGQVKIIKDLDTTIEGKDVIIVEDILDSGVTLSYLMKLLQARRPATRWTSIPTTSAWRSPTSLSWATGWIMRRSIGIIRRSPCSSPLFTAKINKPMAAQRRLKRSDTTP